MKKVLLLIINNVMLNLLQHRKIAATIILIGLQINQAVWAYQTVLVDFPENQGWHSVYYDTQAGESILQYVPIGDTYEDWNRTVIFHSYKNLVWTNSAATLIDRLTRQMELKNSTQLYKNLKYSYNDSIATRCVQKNEYIPTQCEILRTSQSHEGLITMHYINKNPQNFRSTYNLWYQIIKDVRIYYSYYMDDRILDKATSFEM